MEEKLISSQSVSHLQFRPALFTHLHAFPVNSRLTFAEDYCFPYDTNDIDIKVVLMDRVESSASQVTWNTS